MFQVISRNILCCLIGAYFCKSQLCDGSCCDGYIFDPVDASCKRCSPGYFGANCSIHCPYPLYGHKCQSVCSCKKNTCNPAKGCLHAGSTEVVVTTKPSSTKIENNKITSTTNPSSAEKKNKETTSHHSKATIRNRNVFTFVHSTTTKTANEQTAKESYPYLIGIFVLILVLTLAYIGKCFYKRLFKTNNFNNISQPETAEVPGNGNELDMRIPYDVIEETTHSDVRQVDLQTYRHFYDAANETLQPYEVVGNQKSNTRPHEEFLLQDLKPEENVSNELKIKERQVPSLENPENEYLTVLA